MELAETGRHFDNVKNSPYCVRISLQGSDDTYGENGGSVPVTTSIDCERRLVVHAIEGMLASGDFVKAIADRLEHPDFEAGLNVLWDFSNAPDGIMPSRDLRGMLEYGKQEGHGARMGRVALLTPALAHFAMASAVEKISESLAVELKAFQDRAEAMSWLAGENESGASHQSVDSEEK